MNWLETFNLVISVLAVSISGYSIYLTDQNKQKQQSLEKEMQKKKKQFLNRNRQRLMQLTENTS